MTIRIRRSTATAIDLSRLPALMTDSLLSPTNDDAPDVGKQKPGSRWVRWGDSQQKPPPKFD